MRTESTAAIARVCATILPTLLGQGLIYLCISGKLSLAEALAALATLAAVLVVAVGMTRYVEERRLVETNRGPALWMRQARKSSVHRDGLRLT